MRPNRWLLALSLLTVLGAPLVVLAADESAPPDPLVDWELTMRAAMDALKKEDFEAAVTSARDAVTKAEKWHVGDRAKAIRDKQQAIGSALLVLGQAYISLQKWDLAEATLQRSVSVLQEVLGDQSEHTIQAMARLAATYQHEGKLEKVLPLYEKIRDMINVKSGQHDTRVAMMEVDMGQLLVAMKRLPEAQASFARALNILEADRSDDPKVAYALAVCLQNLGQIYKSQRQYALAEQAFESLLEKMEKKAGPAHPALLGVLFSLSDVMAAQKKMGEAEAYVRRGVNIIERQYGVEHPKVLPALEGMARILRAADKTDQAKETVERILRIRERNSTGDDLALARTLGEFAGLWSDDPGDRTEQMLKRAMAIYAKKAGTGHPLFMLATEQLQSYYMKRQTYDMALGLGQRLIPLLQTRLGSMHPKVGQQLLVMGKASLQLGQYANARQYLEHAAQIAQQKNASPQLMLELLHQLMASYHGLGDQRRALEMATAALKMAPGDGMNYVMRAALYYDIGSFSDAEKDLMQASRLTTANPDYDQLRLWLVRARLNKRDEATDALAQYFVQRGRQPDGDWPQHLIGLLLDATAVDDLVRIAQATKNKDMARDRLCEAYFYAGSKRLIDGDSQAAAALLHKCVDTKASDNAEYISAVAELKRLGEQ